MPRNLSTPDAASRRALFPRGLTQPAQGFRFGADTLLLAAFAAAQLKPGPALTGPALTGPALTGLDLGTGCGAASFGLLLLRPGQELHVTGLDIGPEMLAAARENAEALGLGAQYTPVAADVQHYRGPALCDFVLANPPFRVPGTGRACPEQARHRARFEGPGGFAAFAACAARNLRPGGRFFLVHLAERLPELICALQAAGLKVRRLLPVQGHGHTSPRLALILAVRGGGAGLSLDCPLVLYGPEGDLTPQALAFCPHLSANPARNRRKAKAPATFPGA